MGFQMRSIRGVEHCEQEEQARLCCSTQAVQLEIAGVKVNEGKNREQDGQDNAHMIVVSYHSLALNRFYFTTIRTRCIAFAAYGRFGYNIAVTMKKSSFQKEES